MPIIMEFDTPDDDAHDQTWPLACATAEFVARVLGWPVSVSDGFGTTQDFEAGE